MESKFPPSIDHIGISVRRMENGFEFFSKIFGVAIPGEISTFVNYQESMCPNLKGGGYRLSLIPTGGSEGVKLEMYEARAKGWEHDLLEKAKTDMAVGEIGFQVHNIEKYYDRVREMGLTPTDVNGEPLVDRKFDMASQAGLEIRFFFLNLPVHMQKGPVIEVIEYIKTKTHKDKGPKSAPRKKRA